MLIQYPQPADVAIFFAIWVPAVGFLTHLGYAIGGWAFRVLETIHNLSFLGERARTAMLRDHLEHEDPNGVIEFVEDLRFRKKHWRGQRHDSEL